MSSLSFRPRAGLRAVLCLLAVVAVSLSQIAADPVPSNKPATYPDWWFSRSVIPRVNPANTTPVWPGAYKQADDFAALNQGQLKYLATAAYDELEAHFPGGAGSDVLDMVKSWYELPNNVLPPAGARTPKATGSNPYLAVNLGQLKQVATPFYDRLLEEGACLAYPWDFARGLSDDSAVANLGQAKNVFRFSTTADMWLDANDDGVPDWFAAAAGLDAEEEVPAVAPAGALSPSPSGSVTLDETQTGPNGGVLSKDDGINPSAWPAGVSCWTRSSFGQGTKTIAFRAFEDPPKYYLGQSETYSVLAIESDPDDPDPDDANTHKVVGGGMAWLDPLHRTFRYGGSENRSWKDGAFNAKSADRETTSLHLPSPGNLGFSMESKSSFTGYHPEFTFNSDYDPDWKESSHRRQNATFIPSATPLRWNGYDFISAGAWSGTDQSDDVQHDQSGDSNSTETTPIGALPHSSLDAASALVGMYYPFDPFIGEYDLQHNDPPLHVESAQQMACRVTTDTISFGLEYELKIRYTRRLFSEYTKSAMIRDALLYQADYEPAWQERSLIDGSPVAYWNLPPPQSDLDFERCQYKFHVSGPGPATLSWFEVFVPPVSDGEPQYVLRHWDVPQNASERTSPIWQIDPSIRGRNGYYYLLPAEAPMVDANRDGKMSFTDPSIHDLDGTTKEKPFAFWINDDYDKGATVDGNDWEQDDYEGKKDSDDEVVEWRRDLEDLTRLWVSFKGLSGMLQEQGVVLKIEMKPSQGETWAAADGNPAIRIFPAYEKQDGGNKYLFDDATAWEQVDRESHFAIWGQAFGKAGKDQACQIPVTDYFPVWTKPSEDNPFRYLLFEGVSKGKGRLIVTIYKDGNKVVEYPPVYIELKEAKEMFEHWSIGSSPSGGIDYSLHPSVSATRLQALPNPKTDEELDYILFVHGWNMRSKDKANFAETGFKRLWHQGYKGQFGYFEWPAFYISDFPGQDAYLGAPVLSPGTVWTGLNKNNFDASEKNAWESGVGLLDCFQKLNASHPGRVRAFAHSQGNIVVGEALRTANHSQVIHTYIASQAALTADCYDRTAADMAKIVAFGFQSTPDIYSRSWKMGAPSLPENWTDAQSSYLSADYMSAAAGRYVNFYNPLDYALGGTVWQLNQQLKADDDFAYIAFEGFLKYEGPFPQHRNLTLPENRFETMAFAAEARAFPLGNYGDTRGVFQEGDVFNVQGYMDKSRPQDNYSEHKYHSGQFRGTYMQRWKYWRALLDKADIRHPEVFIP